MGRFRKVNTKKFALTTPIASNIGEKYIFQLSPKYPERKQFEPHLIVSSSITGIELERFGKPKKPISGIFWRNNSRAKYVNKNKWILVTVHPADEEIEGKEIWITPQHWEITNVWEDTQFNESQSWATQDLGKIFDDYEKREPIVGGGGNSWLFNTTSPHRWPDIILDHYEGKVLYGDKRVIDIMVNKLGGPPQSINKGVIR